MAIFTKPDKTNIWASAPTNPTTDVIEPDLQHLEKGWIIAEEPPAPYFNFLQQTNWFWFRWLNQSHFDITGSPTTEQGLTISPYLPTEATKPTGGIFELSSGFGTTQSGSLFLGTAPSPTTVGTYTTGKIGISSGPILASRTGSSGNVEISTGISRGEENSSGDVTLQPGNASNATAGGIVATGGQSLEPIKETNFASSDTITPYYGGDIVIEAGTNESTKAITVDGAPVTYHGKGGNLFLRGGKSAVGANSPGSVYIISGNDTAVTGNPVTKVYSAPFDASGIYILGANSSPAGIIRIQGGLGTTGGEVGIYGGGGGSGGNVAIVGGVASAIKGGDVSITGGGSAQTTGSVFIATRPVQNVAYTPGKIAIETLHNTQPGDTGAIEIKTGISDNNDSGIIEIDTGDAQENSGSITIKSGAADVGNSGNIIVQCGNSTSGIGGNIEITGGNGIASGGKIQVRAGNAVAGVSVDGGSVEISAGRNYGDGISQIEFFTGNPTGASLQSSLERRAYINTNGLILAEKSSFLTQPGLVLNEYDPIADTISPGLPLIKFFRTRPAGNVNRTFPGRIVVMADDGIVEQIDDDATNIKFNNIIGIALGVADDNDVVRVAIGGIAKVDRGDALIQAGTTVYPTTNATHRARVSATAPPGQNGIPTFLYARVGRALTDIIIPDGGYILVNPL